MPKKTALDKSHEDLVETSEEPKSDETKCDNHPHRKARNYTGNGAFSINLCDECTPSWFKE